MSVSLVCIGKRIRNKTKTLKTVTLPYKYPFSYSPYIKGHSFDFFPPKKLKIFHP